MEILANEPTVPGEFQCAQCGFVVIKSTINPDTEIVGRNNADTLEPCPNDGTILRPVTYREALQEARRDSILIRSRELDLRRLIYRLTSELQGNFWRCLKCQHIVHSYRQVHACRVCKNGGGSGWWTSTSFDEWEKQNPMPADFEIGGN